MATHKIIGKYIINTDMKDKNIMAEIKKGDFTSWSVITDNIIIKHCDMSVFEHHGSAIDARVRTFWNVQHLSYPGRLNLIIRYNNQDYNAHIEFDKNQRTRIFWAIELKALFAKQPHSVGNYPDLRFERIGHNKYEATFININTIESDVQDDLESYVEEVAPSLEGRKVKIYTTKYERNPQNRKQAIKIHGTKCMVCGFDFYATYGDIGRDFIEVHHTKPLYSLDDEINVNPETDLVCVCSNCHRMIHRKRNFIISIDKLRKIIYFPAFLRRS